HAGVEHGAERPYLRDSPRDPGISRGALGRPARPDICRAGSIRTCAGGLSLRSAALDTPPRRTDVAAVAAARARTRGDLSLVPLERQVGIEPDQPTQITAPPGS